MVGGKINFGGDGEVAVNHSFISDVALEPYKVGDLSIESYSSKLMNKLMSDDFTYNKPKSIVRLKRSNNPIMYSLLSGDK